MLSNIAQKENIIIMNNIEYLHRIYLYIRGYMYIIIIVCVVHVNDAE